MEAFAGTCFCVVSRDSLRVNFFRKRFFLSNAAEVLEQSGENVGQNVGMHPSRLSITSTNQSIKKDKKRSGRFLCSSSGNSPLFGSLQSRQSLPQPANLPPQIRDLRTKPAFFRLRHSSAVVLQQMSTHTFRPIVGKFASRFLFVHGFRSRRESPQPL